MENIQDNTTAEKSANKLKSVISGVRFTSKENLISLFIINVTLLFHFIFTMSLHLI